MIKCKFRTCVSDMIERVERMGHHFTCKIPEPNHISYYNPYSVKTKMELCVYSVVHSKWDSVLQWYCD